MTDDPNEPADETDDETDDEREARRARIRAWLASLPPPLGQFYAYLKRMDPKGQPRR